MYVEYVIQPDDCNHLYVYDNDKRIIELRVWGEELHYLLRGILHPRHTSSPLVNDYLRTAVFFKTNKIDKVVIRSYAGVNPSFQYEVRPEQIEVIPQGLGKTTYVLKLDDKEVYIDVKNFTVKLTEFPRKRREEVERKEIKKEDKILLLKLKLSISKINELIDYVQNTKRISRDKLINELKMIKLYIESIYNLLNK